jgi:tetratricopeptide (TPR) repeat protein
MKIIDWLRLLAQIFYAPVRGMREVRDHGGLLTSGTLALISQVAYVLVTQYLSGFDGFLIAGPGQVFRFAIGSALPLILIAAVLVPVVTFVANLFERKGSFGLVLQQEYASLAATIFYALTIANVFAILVALVLNVTGFQAAYVANSAESSAQIREWVVNSSRITPELKSQLETVFIDTRLVAIGLFRTIRLSIFVIAALVAIREVFRFTVPKSIAVIVISLALALLLSPLWALLFSPILASPFLLIMIFLLLRGYISGIMETQRARESFKRNLEAATLNPADASAHYNLGLIHQLRGELDEARERFERAVQIDADEVDSHYQLGRIARQQKRLGDAIGHFEQVVSRDPDHAQQEVWREVGATYVAAGQFADAMTALERFLERRPSDPETLYLMGRAHAGLGHQREATSSMQACIEAVKTAPAYKYRADKRWLNEAQQFIKSSQ